MKEYKLKINGNNYNVAINEVKDTTASVEVNGSSFTVEFEKPISKPKAIKVVRKESAAPAVTPSTRVAEKAAPVSGTVVNSPLPGVILSVDVKEGEQVKSGQKLLVLEAMKMENTIEAPANGVVKSIKVNKGDSVLEGEPLVILG
jgi:glutaconyl-CoA/methylmalonyl-CoA decarboxylase subunit gamma